MGRDRYFFCVEPNRVKFRYVSCQLEAMVRAPLTGWLALLGAIAAVALPTVVRVAVNGVVTGCEFTPYLPFVLISAILLGWKHAIAVALASVVVLGGLFFGSAPVSSCTAMFSIRRSNLPWIVGNDSWHCGFG